MTSVPRTGASAFLTCAPTGRCRLEGAQLRQCPGAPASSCGRGTGTTGRTSNGARDRRCRSRTLATPEANSPACASTNSRGTSICWSPVPRHPSRRAGRGPKPRRAGSSRAGRGRRRHHPCHAQGGHSAVDGEGGCRSARGNPAFSLPLSPYPAMVVQFKTSLGTCWEATFLTAIRSTAREFKAKSATPP